MLPRMMRLKTKEQLIAMGYRLVQDGRCGGYGLEPPIADISRSLNIYAPFMTALLGEQVEIEEEDESTCLTNGYWFNKHCFEPNHRVLLPSFL